MAQSPEAPCCGHQRPERVLRAIQVNLLECKVCFEKFSAEQRRRRPQNLSCGHVLCLDCIGALAHPLLRTLECPFCRQPCSTDNISNCRALDDLQELLSSRSSASPPPAPPWTKGVADSAAGPATAGLGLRTAFGGWGTLVNPTGMAVSSSSGKIVVVHDGEKGVVVFSPRGRKLLSFGPRGRASGEICYPVDVAVTPCSRVVVTDAGSKAVKVFTSEGDHLLTVEDSFRMPWGVDTDSRGHILVSDVHAGTLSRIKVNYANGLVLELRTVLSDLQHPKAVACCHVTGTTTVMEHLSGPPGRHRRPRLLVFGEDFQLLYQTDGFGLSLRSSARLNMSAVAFGRDGNVIVTDSCQGMVWSLGKLQNGVTLTPLVGEHLIRPTGLAPLGDTLVVLDSGDHTVKIYSAKADAGSITE